jgi:anti-sigma factor RsiW
MNCKKIVKMLPDYRLGRGRPVWRRAITAHLNDCAACREQLKIWENFCAFSVEQLRIPNSLDWTPLQRALDAEQRRASRGADAAPHPVFRRKRRTALPARRLQPASPRRFGYRLLVVGAAVMVLLGLWMRPFRQTSPALKYKLTLESEFVAEASNGDLVYREIRAKQIYHQEVVKIVPAQDNLPHWQDIPDPSE